MWAKVSIILPLLRVTQEEHYRVLDNPGDGGGLYLLVSAYDTKAWIYRFTLEGKAWQIGLGPLHTITLAEARKASRECRQQLREGVDPIEQRTP